jgi:hypothetical protein
VDSPPGGGTRVVAELPLDRAFSDGFSEPAAG